MGRFTKIIKKKKMENTLNNHPLANIDENEKKDYLQSLVFLAVEDENFSDEEKEYISFVNKAIGLDESMMENFEAFANNPDENELLSLVGRLKDFQEDIKFYLLVDICVVAFKDGEFDNNEMEIFDEYLEILNMENKKQTVLYLADIINQKDIDNAISFSVAYKEIFNKYKHIFSLLDINIEQSIKDIYNYEWVRWEFEFGGVEDDSKIATKPVSARQYKIFINALLMSGELKRIPETTRFEIYDELFIYDIEFINITFENGLFRYEDSQKDEPIVGQSIENIMISFVKYLHALLGDEKLELLKLYGDGAGNIRFFDDCIGKPDLLGEVFYQIDLKNYKYYVSENFNANANGYTKDTEIFSLKNSNSKLLTFRIMKSE